MSTRDIISLIAVVREKANRFIVQEMSTKEMEGLAPSHGDILSALFEYSSLTMKDLAKKINKDKSTVTALVNKLLNLGYIERTRDIADSRIVYITLTEKGENLKGDFKEISDKLIERVYKDISKSEQEVLINILTKIYNNF
ncbi:MULTISPECIES: MarR family winged helix-turn-helix transcriptional regulator [Clostridium]|jgi:DNA-binding MarR family transcriptional regulator|uniref:Transcriptional regulator, MarR family n=1 Tax=Clostridium saccharoperbutylacetonicum N1-4(HMT) TaxID=931276 RepID=M1MK03_9CLOT|nr:MULTISPECIES: MarR family transcriptional regulator [Clostridium]AGF55151.1 transcriptional regulator, MarR family [Clostridium saccharoperbutylacetonicum N1-4(HMT)]AQR94043.1 multidrug resistance operon repressor [Clostridium saccharoperbutylacetonicum]NRT64140.1 DNA-binding MarR family transcriptional regulator [Clostridium saccharoperbutylacetonicum]NSB27507.1 DNA-binding MarR family transcriptional regulator [Clostridium saccharoperbutylacetonicum]NSB29742.1 DNA-binding MarR family tran